MSRDGYEAPSVEELDVAQGPLEVTAGINGSIE